MADRPKTRVLVAEDEALVTMLIEEELADAGFLPVGPFATCAEAQAWLGGDTPDLAVLDAQLADGPCTDVAHELRRRGVPFVLLSGSDRSRLPRVLSEAPWIAKPSTLAGLVGMLRSLRGGSPAAAPS